MLYDFNGDEYKKASAHQKDWGIRIINELQLKGDESILDLGCGDGFLTEILAGMVPEGRAVGIDAAPGMIRTAKKIKKNNLYFELMNINDMDFHEEFDVIFSNATLHWLSDHKQLLISCYKALTADGIIRFNFAGKGNAATFYSVVRNVMAEEGFNHYFETFTWPWYMPDADEYTDFMKITNYRNIKVWNEKADRYFPDREALVQWIDNPSLVPFLKQVTNDGDRLKFRNTVIELMIEETSQENGSFLEKFRRLNVSAIK